MKKKPQPNLRFIIALSLFLLPSISFGQDAAVTPLPVIAFDAEKLAASAKSLSGECNMNFDTVQVSQMLNLFTKRYKLSFDTKTVAAEIAKPVSLNVAGVPMGEALLKVLRKIDCTFSIAPNGTIKIRKSPVTEAAETPKTKAAKP